MLDRTRRLNAEERAMVVQEHGNGSARTIALKFGVSRNVVIGLWSRAGKTRPDKKPQEKPVRRNKGFALFKLQQPPTRAERLRKIAASRAEVAAVERGMTVKEVPATAVGFMDAQLCHCRFVVGKGGDDLALFCGANVKRGSWCGEHLSLVFEAVPA